MRGCRGCVARSSPTATCGSGDTMAQGKVFRVHGDAGDRCRRAPAPFGLADDVTVGNHVAIEKVAALEARRLARTSRRLQSRAYSSAQSLKLRRHQYAEASIVFAEDQNGADIAKTVGDRLQRLRPARRLKRCRVDFLDRRYKSLIHRSLPERQRCNLHRARDFSKEVLKS